MKTMIETLKKATRELHEQVEQENLARFIMDYSIDEATYKLLLLQNYVAYKTTEEEIARHLPFYEGKKHQELAKDLEQLNVPVSLHSFEGDFRCQTRPQAYGAAYVVEGSALGGMVLARNVTRCEKLSHINSHHFFNGDQNNITAWKKFKEELSLQEFSEEEKEQATQMAKATFRYFRKVFQTGFSVAAVK